jgi:hypothetical protein
MAIVQSFEKLAAWYFSTMLDDIIDITSDTSVEFSERASNARPLNQ